MGVVDAAGGVAVVGAAGSEDVEGCVELFTSSDSRYSALLCCCVVCLMWWIVGVLGCVVAMGAAMGFVSGRT